jgi:molybdopterin converting factor small subunit
MEVYFKFIGNMRLKAGGKSEHTVALPEGCTLGEAFRTFDIDYENSSALNFAVVNGKKTEDAGYVLKDGDEVKAFPRSFGG